MICSCIISLFEDDVVNDDDANYEHGAYSKLTSEMMMMMSRMMERRWLHTKAVQLKRLRRPLEKPQ